MLHHAVDEVEDGGGLPAWTEKEDALFPLVPPAIRCWWSGSLHPPAGSVRDGPATRPRLVSLSHSWLILVLRLPQTSQISGSSINLLYFV